MARGKRASANKTMGNPFGSLKHNQSSERYHVGPNRKLFGPLQFNDEFLCTGESDREVYFCAHLVEEGVKSKTWPKTCAPFERPRYVARSLSISKAPRTAAASAVLAVLLQLRCFEAIRDVAKIDADSSRKRRELFGLLFVCQLLPVYFLQLRNAGLEPLRIHEAVRVIGVARLVFVVHIKLSGVGCEEQVNFRSFLVVERAGVCLGDVWKLRHPPDTHTRVDAAHVHDPNSLGLVVLADIKREAGGSFGVPGMKVRRNVNPTQFDFVALL